MKFTDKIRHHWSKLVAPLTGQVLAQGYWLSGWDYYQHYCHHNLPGLAYYVCWSSHQEIYTPPRSIYPQPHQGFQRTTVTIPETYWLAVPQAIVLSARQSVGSVIAHDGRVIHDSSRQWSRPPTDNQACHYKFPRPRTVEKTIAAVGIGGGGMNYYHWLVDVLLRIHLLQYGDIWDRIDYFLLDEPSPKLAITLDILGIHPSQRLYARFDRTLASPLIVSPKFPTSTSPAWHVEFLRRTFLPYCDTTRCGMPQKIYISRAKASRRRIVNEEELLGYLAPLGYRPVWLEDLSFVEQISLFAQAQRVIGMHGAGLTNILWCPPGSRVLEIFPSASIATYYWVLANHVGMDYHYFVSNAPPLPQQDTVINLRTFRQAVELFES